MRETDLVELLKYVTANDGRPRSPEDMKATTAMWWDLIGDLDYGDALTAARAHFQATSRWITPADIRNGVQVIRARRLQQAPPVGALMDDVDPDHPRWTAVLAARIGAIASGTDPAAIAPPDPSPALPGR